MSSEEVKIEGHIDEVESSTPHADEEIGGAAINGGDTTTRREAEIKSKIHFIKAALKNLKSNFPQFKSVRGFMNIFVD